MGTLGRIYLPVALALSLLAAPAAAQDPVALSPADGASIAAGAGVTFQVQDDPGDATLFVRVSRSPDPVDACGAIGSDLEIETLAATSTPGVFAGTPTVFQSYDFWLNRAGTYYWQALRYGGPDGCVESPARALHVTGIRPVEVGPQPLEPADGAQLATGGIAFRVSAMDQAVDKYLWLHVSRSPSTDVTGVLGDDAEIEELVPTGMPAIWSAIPAYYTYPAFWMNTPGTYYWQPYRISTFGDPDGFVEGPVRSFTLTGSATPSPTPTPTPTPTPAPPATIRGDEAFVKGTSNDLYLACSTLDVYLVDVLPSGRRVSVTGAADVRLAGQTARIMLDGRQVGSAVIGSGGAFAATVRAPSKARRPKARYQAIVGASRSQNLKLERRMVAVALARKGDTFTLTGRITRPFAKRRPTIAVQRYIACGRLETLARRTLVNVRPTSTGRFSVSFPVPPVAARALMFRATTKVPKRPGGSATYRTYTLPRAVDVG